MYNFELLLHCRPRTRHAQMAPRIERQRLTYPMVMMTKANLVKQSLIRLLKDV